MGKPTFVVEGHREAAAKFDNIRRATEAQLDVAVRAAALKVEGSAKAKAPVLTGALRRSITSTRER